MKFFDKLSKIYAKANPFVKYLTVTSLISSAITISTDIGNIISTLTNESKIYEEPDSKPINYCLAPEMFQKTI